MTDKPKRPATSGTRRGNGASKHGVGQGAGYGGAAKGAGNGAAKQDFSLQTNAQGHNGTTTAAQGNKLALWRERSDELMNKLYAIGSGAEEALSPSQIKAIETYQNRTWGTPKQTVALEGDAEKPLSFVFMGVPEKATSEEWAKEHSQG